MFYNYFNPYYGENFFEFLMQFFYRLFSFVTGKLPIEQLAADEIQIFVLIGVSTSTALVGTYLIFKNMSMLANSISHTILIGIVIAFLLTRDSFLEVDHDHATINVEIMLVASLIMGIITSLLTEFLTKFAKLQEDASTGLVFTTLFAIGIIMVTILTRNAHIGAEVVMGNVDALHIDDLKLVYIVLISNVLLFTIFYKEFLITTFDPALAKVLGYSVIFFNYLLMLQVSATVVSAFRAVGVLMVLAFITGPPLTARMLTDNLKKMLFLSVGIGSFSSLIGVALSRHFLSTQGLALSTSGVVVCCIIATYIIVLFFAPNKGLYSLWKHRQKQKKIILK